MPDEITQKDNGRWELGSEYSWCEPPQPPLLTWPKPIAWYLLARHAVAAVVQHYSIFHPTLWIPSYFCPEVAECSRQFFEVQEYRDDPRWPEPDWESLKPRPRDFVLAVNYFGVREGTPWAEWRKRNDCFLLEDHSQDPFSSWAVNSEADYAFASLRKTLPVPDGAILFSPRGLPIPVQPTENGDWHGSATKLAAMLCKKAYLDGRGGPELKKFYRTLQLEGEQRLRESRISPITPHSLSFLEVGVPERWRSRRLENARSLTERLNSMTVATPLFSNWPAESVPFAVPLVFPSSRERDEYQAALRLKRIYCAVHWVCQTREVEALDLSSRILSLPIDQRYGREDMNVLANELLDASSRRANQEKCAAISDLEIR